MRRIAAKMVGAARARAAHLLLVAGQNAVSIEEALTLLAGIVSDPRWALVEREMALRAILQQPWRQHGVCRIAVQSASQASEPTLRELARSALNLRAPRRRP